MMSANQLQDMLLKLLACTECSTTGLLPVVASGCLECVGCGKRFPVINGIPCFVPDELVNFSEVDEADRSSFIRAKRLAYSGDSFISRMYNHYHRYAASQRVKVARSPLTLDIACGIGEHYPFITERERTGESLIGLDLDRFKLEYFHDMHREIPLVQATAFDLPFSAGCFDVVQLLAVLEHFSDDEIKKVIDECLRVLRPGGTLIMCYPAEGGFWLRMGQMLMHAYIRLKTGFNLEEEKIHDHISTAVEIAKILIVRPDLELIDRMYYPFGIPSAHGSLFINATYQKKRVQEL